MKAYLAIKTHLQDGIEHGIEAVKDKLEHSDTPAEKAVSKNGYTKRNKNRHAAAQRHDTGNERYLSQYRHDGA